MRITFNELRRVKDSLPHGAMHKIAEDLNLSVETVRNYFGGSNYEKGVTVGFHTEQGQDGGIVEMDDATIFNKAVAIIDEV